MNIFLNFDRPTVGIGCFAPLNAREGIVEILSGLADLEVIDGVVFITVGKLTDRRNDSRGAATPVISFQIPKEMNSSEA